MNNIKATDVKSVQVVIICAKIRQPAFGQMILRLSPSLFQPSLKNHFGSEVVKVSAGSLTFFSTNNYYAGCVLGNGSAWLTFITHSTNPSIIALASAT